MYVYDSAALVKGYSRTTSVFVLPRLTLARHRRLQIEVLEKNEAGICWYRHPISRWRRQS